MLLDTLRRARKGMFATKVRQHPVQSARPPPGSNAQALRQGTQVTLGRAAPDPLAHLDQPEDTPPLQRFFLRLRTVGSCCRSSVVTRASAWRAHWCMVVLPSRRSSWISSSSTTSALFNGPSSLRTISKMLWTRSLISGCWRRRPSGWRRGRRRRRRRASSRRARARPRRPCGRRARRPARLRHRPDPRHLSHA